MAGSDKQSWQARSPSLLTMAVERAEIAREDAVARHSEARARRERRPGLLVGASAVQQDLQSPVEPLQAADDIQTPASGNSYVEPEWADAAEPMRAPARSEVKPVRVAGFVCVGALLGAALSLAWPTTYIASAELLIDPRAAQPAAAAQLSPDAALALVDNQMRMLRSGTILGAAADRLNLPADAEFNGGGGLLSSVLGEEGGSAVAQRRRQAVVALGQAVSVEREGASSVVALSAKTSDPQKSALIANTISDIFVESVGGQPAASGERLVELRDAVNQAERAVEAYRAANGLIDAQGTLITDEEILRLGEQVSAARARTVELNARAASTRDANVDSIVTGSLPEQFSSPSLSELRARHAASRQQLDRLSVKLGPRHPERLAAEAEVEATRQEISAELRRVASALQTELKRAVEQEQQLTGQLASMKVRQGGIGSEMIELRELERQAELRRTAYEEALRASQKGGAPSGAASIISRAEAPMSAAGFSLPTFTLAGGLLGLAAGLGLGGWRRRDGEATGDVTADHADKFHRDDGFGAAEAGNTGKEADAVYPYHPYAPHPSAMPAQPEQPAAAQQPQQAAPHYHPPHPAPQMMHPYAPMPTAYSMAPVAAPPPGWQHWQPAPQAYAPPMMQPHDPWAHMRGWANMPPPYAPQPWAPSQPQVVFIAVPQPMPSVQQALPAIAEPTPVVQSAAAQQQTRPVDRWRDQDRFVDDSTDAAIEEIRRNLREFREAIEDFADDRTVYNQPRRRFGT